VNVLIVVPWDQRRGGVASVVNSLARHLQTRGHGVVFLHPRETAASARGRTTQAGFRGYELDLRSPSISAHPIRSAAAFWLKLPRTVVQILSLLRRESIDVVSVHYPLASFLPLAISRVFRRFGLVVSAHGGDLVPPEAPGPRPDWALRLLLRTCDRFTTPSHDFLRTALDLVPGLAAVASVVPNGIDPGDFTASPPRAPAQRGFALCLASHTPEKGLDVLLHAVALARAAGADVPLVLAGDGPLRKDLEVLAARLQIGDLVRFVGFLELDAVRALLRDCSLVVVPSTFESFGIVVLEAMASRRAVIGTRVGGIPEIISHGVTGWLVNPSDPVALADALRTLMLENDLRATLAAAGFDLVTRAFTDKRMAAEYEALFETVQPAASRGSTPGASDVIRLAGASRG
jgi:glycosyltransferase involved in cell wall biosynthesis